ncbi:hypothetical protein FOA52_003366 [Chlamydomonas sp. UWO 241]|nr:hypothetical protein FOA52_003366 [Chlamydomonas sp. UWO 241]
MADVASSSAHDEPQYASLPPVESSPPMGRSMGGSMSMSMGGGQVSAAESSSKLYRDISPTRVHMMGSGGRDTRLPDLFKQKGGLESLRPSYAPQEDDYGGDSALAPRLLARLEALLEEKLSLVDRVGSASKGFAATQMRTDAYRQVFDAFLHSFTTYRSLLMRVKHAYDAALDDALASVYDNVHMRAELAAAEEMMDTCVAEAKSKALDDAAVMRQELQDQYQQQERVAGEAEARCRAAETSISSARSSISALRAEAASLIARNRELKHIALSASSWASPKLLQHYAPPGGGAADCPSGGGAEGSASPVPHAAS